MAFRRTTDLPCKISKNISLRLHPKIYLLLSEEAGRRPLEKGKKVTVGDIVREFVSERLPAIGEESEPSLNSKSVESTKPFYRQLFFAL